VSDIANKRVFISGSRGMVGGNIVAYARKSGWQIFAPSRDELELQDTSAVARYLKETEIEAVIHCAARVGGIAANVAAPADFIIDNIKIDSSIISSARELEIEEFIYFASSCMYPRNTTQPMKEDQILTSTLEPTNEGYALSKIVGAKAVAAIAVQDGLNWRVLIPSNLYGPGDNFDKDTSHLVPSVIQKISSAISANQSSVEIWGNGEAKREFTYVGDVAEFVIENIHNLNLWPLMMNLGYGEDFSVNTYYKEIADALSFSGTFFHNLSKPVGMEQKLLDSSIAKENGWRPKTSLDSGIEKTIKWFQENISND